MTLVSRHSIYLLILKVFFRQHFFTQGDELNTEYERVTIEEMVSLLQKNIW
jgi:hypothetical protein